jgi:hypothetical protein
MASMRVRVNIDTEKIIARFAERNNRGLLALKGQIAADTAQYLPRITGDLEHSIHPSSESADSKLIWNIPYARRQYYGQFKHSAQSHPLACRLWYEVAKAQFKETWRRVVERVYKGMA